MREYDERPILVGSGLFCRNKGSYQEIVMPMLELGPCPKIEMTFDLAEICTAQISGPRYSYGFASSASQRYHAVMVGVSTAVFLYKNDDDSYTFHPELILQMPIGLRPNKIAVDTHRFAVYEDNGTMHIWVFDLCVWRKDFVFSAPGSCQSLEWNNNGTELVHQTPLNEVHVYQLYRVPVIGLRYWSSHKLKAPTGYVHVPSEQLVHS